MYGNDKFKLEGGILIIQKAQFLRSLTSDVDYSRGFINYNLCIILFEVTDEKNEANETQ